METNQTKKSSICWKCKNAVPSASTGCSWSRAFQPVEGWTAERKYTPKANGSTGEVYETYCVTACPEFRKDAGGETMCKNNEGCLWIAEHVLRLQMNKYRSALQRYARSRSDNDLAQLKAVERELFTPYYAALTLHSIDLRQVCNVERRRVGLPELSELEEMQ
ncbi:hypothetical protein [Ruminococcus sp.]|uniref:hypothetical protein n=1 Tax=Ruminococcus sp. TaxID=41978 RepID=UPI0025F5565C|nr:hypothetical protein [Ruminococcus sp.]